MASKIAAPLYCIQHSRFTKQDGWELYDLSLSLNGNIAVTGCNENTHRKCIDLYTNVRHSDSKDKLKIIYSKEFEKYVSEGSVYWGPRVSFYPASDTTVLSGLGDKLEVIDLIQDRVIKSRKIKLGNHGQITCLSVRETEIFIGFYQSNKITVYDVRDLNKIKSIILRGTQDGHWPYDMTAITDRIFVCTTDSTEENKYEKSLIFEEKSGRILSELTKPTDTVQWYVNSVGVSMNTLGIACLVWYDSLYYKEGDHNTVVFYTLLSENNCSFLIVEVEYGVGRIRISDRGDRMITGHWKTGEVKVYDMANMFTYSSIKENLVSRLNRNDCEKLIDFFAMGEEETKNILNSDSPPATLLLALEEKGVIQRSSLDRLKEAFLGLEMSSSFHHVVNVYQKLRDQTTSYHRFLAILSAHLTSSSPAELCDSFQVSDEQKYNITSSQNPGLSLLLVLDEMGVIKSSDVGSLEEQFQKFKLVQAVAKVHEYQERLKEEKGLLLQTAPQNLEEKRSTFVEFLKKKIQSWYETMTPVPWKKSCQWKSTDLFVGSGLILTDSKAKRIVHNIDEQCKLNYTDIFSHPKLKSETRLILEGDPGAGKTMLSSQVAYDWSRCEIHGVDILIFLPLKIVEDRTLIQTIKEFYIPENMPLSEKDIETILATDAGKICLLLDGFEEYNTGGRMRDKESSEVMKVMRKEKHSNCKVVITSRSDFAQDLPECPLLKIGRFGEKERTSYIEKLSPDNHDKQLKIKRIIQDNPFLLDLCTVPLLFVLAVHNIESMTQDSQLNKVSPFVRSMILTLCPATTVEQEEGATQDRSEKMTLGELAFNGLCKGYQQLSWTKDFMESNVGNLKSWVDSGVLVLEEGVLTTEKEDNMQSKVKMQEEKRDKKKRKKQKEKGIRTSKQDDSNEGQTKKSTWDSFRFYKEEKVKDGKPKVKKEKEIKDKKRADGLPVEAVMLSAKFPELSPACRKSPVPLESYNLFDQPSTRYEIPHMPEIPKEILTTILTEPLTTDEVPTTKELAESLSEHESDSSVINDTTVRRAAQQVPLVIKFLHKVIQEWFAAMYFCSMIKKCKNIDQLHNYVRSHLGHINPMDLHYLLRFSSYLHSPTCPIIIDCLLKSYRTHKNEHVPQYIMNCVFLCFTEHNNVKADWDMRNAVENVCKEVIKIQSEDSRLLQQAKSSLLEFASYNGIIIAKLELEDVISAVSDTALTLNSGVQLGVLSTLKVIQVSRWDQVLQEGDFKNILALLSKGPSTKKIFCIFPNPPPELLDEITLNRIISRDVKVEWNFGHLVQTLDPRKGKWMIHLKLPGAGDTVTENINRKEDEILQTIIHGVPGTSAGHSGHSVIQGRNRQIESHSLAESAMPENIAKVVQEQHDVSDISLSKPSDFQVLLETKVNITMSGGVVEIPNTGVMLTIPPGALPEYMENCAICLRIISGEIAKEEVKSFSSNAATVIELLPDSLKFQYPVRLTLPHCLVLQETGERRARIFISHHGKGSVPQWEEQTHLSYHLEDTACVILLDSLCWIKISIDDEIVEAKKLVMYTAAREFKITDEVAEIYIGYYLDLPGQRKVIEDTQGLNIAHRKPFYFVRKKEDDPLILSLDNIFPSVWQCQNTKPYLKEVQASVIENYRHHSVRYHIKRKTRVVCTPLCLFTVSQKGRQIAVQLVIHLKVKNEDPLPAATFNPIVEHEASSKVQMEITKEGGRLEIPGTGVSLKIPPNALPAENYPCLVHMKISPSRIVEDQVKSLCSNSVTSVEILPCNITLHDTAELILPHCLKLRKERKRKARIFTNLEIGSPSAWKEQSDIAYKLKESNCIISLKQLCCVKFSIDDAIVDAKRVVVYTAAMKVMQMDELAEVEVGYYSDIPGGGELLRLNPDLKFDSKREILLMEEHRYPLQVSLESILPQQWACSVPIEKPQEIPFNVIASSIEHSHLYILEKVSDQPGKVFCNFTATQQGNPPQMELSLVLQAQQEEQHKSTKQADQHMATVDSMSGTFQYLSKNLTGDQWKFLGRKLGLREADFYHIRQNNMGVQESIYQMLVLWQCKNASEATHAKLIQCLEEAERKDLAEDIKNRKDLE